MSCEVSYGSSKFAKSKKIEFVTIEISEQKWNGDNAVFTATVDKSSFNLVEDVTWYISKYFIILFREVNSKNIYNV